MSFITVAAASPDELTIHYELEGELGLPVLALSNSLGMNLSMWDPQLPEFSKHFRVLRYDARGHGGSPVTPGPYSIEQLSWDVVALLDSLNIETASFCGLSMGGMVGQWLGSNAASRLNKLVLCNTLPKIGTAEGWNARIEKVRAGGVMAVVPETLERWFTPGFRAARPEVIAATARMLEATDREGYAASCAAVRDMDQRHTAAEIRVPTLIVASTEDPVTPPEEEQFLLEQIAGAKYFELKAAHLSNVEAADEFTSGVLKFLLD
jgi:3-oxoadipate enol-lactonase